MGQKAKRSRHAKPSKKSLVTAAAVTGGVLAVAGAGAFDLHDLGIFGSTESAAGTLPIPSLAAAVAPNPTPNPLFATAEEIVTPEPDGDFGVGGGAVPAQSPSPAPPAEPAAKTAADPVMCGPGPMVTPDCVTPTLAPGTAFATQVLACAPQNLALPTPSLPDFNSAVKGFGTAISNFGSVFAGDNASTAKPRAVVGPSASPPVTPDPPATPTVAAVDPATPAA